LYSVLSLSSTPPTPSALHPPSLHDALPIYPPGEGCGFRATPRTVRLEAGHGPFGGTPSVWQRQAPARRQHRLVGGQRPYVRVRGDRKSTRLNSSHQIISYAVFCLKKKKT